MSAPPAEQLLALDAAAQELLFRAARTARAFTDEPVTDDQIRAIHDLVKYGPTAYNAQPLRIVLVRSPAARQRLLPHVHRGNRARVESVPVVAILAADTEFHEHLPTVLPTLPKVAEEYAGSENAARRETEARFNAALQVGYFIVGVRAAGLAAGPMAGFEPAGVDAEFFPDGRLRSLLLVNIGRPGPGAWGDRLPRLRHEDVIQTL